MDNEADQSVAKRRHIVAPTLAVGGLLVVIVVLAVIFNMSTSGSVGAFCSTYKQENTRLADSQGSTYSVKPFTHSSSSPRDFVSALSEMERVAPRDIRPDVKTLRQIFEKIDRDPSQGIAASLSGLGAESSVTAWVDEHCK